MLSTCHYILCIVAICVNEGLCCVRIILLQHTICAAWSWSWGSGPDGLTMVRNCNLYLNIRYELTFKKIAWTMTCDDHISAVYLLYLLPPLIKLLNIEKQAITLILGLELVDDHKIFWIRTPYLFIFLIFSF